MTAPAVAEPDYTQISIDSGRVIVGCGLHSAQSGPNAQEAGVRYRQVFVSVQQ